MFVFKAAEIVNATEKLAQKHLDENSLSGERPLNPVRVRELEAEIDGGAFNCSIWAIAELRGTGKQFRADGQHTATALINAAQKGNFPTGAKILIVYYYIDNLDDDASALFLRLDDSDAVRNSTSTMNSLAVKYRELHHATAKFIVAAVAGIVFHLRDLNKRQKDKSKRVIIEKPKFRGRYLSNKGYRAFVLWLHTYKDGRNKWLLQKPAVVAEAMANYFAHSEAATKFWGYFLTDKAPEGHATKKLVDKFNKWVREREIHEPEEWRNAVKSVWDRFLIEYDAEQPKNKKRPS